MASNVRQRRFTLINTLINTKLIFTGSFLLFLLQAGLTYCSNADAVTDSNQKIVYQLDIKNEITPGQARNFAKGFAQALSEKADIILIHMNTYGGLLDAADSIRTRILNSPIPVIVFIDNNAASAGALIAIACNRIYMRKGSSIGAATVVNDQAEALPDKYQSYMRSMMRATAEARQRDPRIAEAMVDARISIPGVSDSGKVLTLTSSEAMDLGYCNGIASTVDEALLLDGCTNAQKTVFHPGVLDRLIGWLIHPAVSGVLILLMLGGLYYELQHPGIGLPLVVALCAALLYFAPLYLEGLAQNWEILVVAIGILLVAVEVFILPGFGIAGIAGIVLLLFGLTVTLIRNDGFYFSGVSSYAFAAATATVLTGMASALLLFLISGKFILESAYFRKMVLITTLNDPKDPTVENDFMPTPGSTGIALTVLKPSGKINIGDHTLTAISETGYIEPGQIVEIVSAGRSGIVVRLSPNKV